MAAPNVQIQTRILISINFNCHLQRTLKEQPNRFIISCVSDEW